MARTIEQMIEERYADNDVRDAILEDIAAQKTADRILSGELVLPSEHDARIWHNRVTGRVQMTDAEQRNNDRIAELERKLSEMQAGGHQ